jgi:hypothetical protein
MDKAGLTARLFLVGFREFKSGLERICFRFAGSLFFG